jgi:hypothetical protein
MAAMPAEPSPAKPEPSPFEKFDALTRAVMSVPKSEVDARESIRKAERAKNPNRSGRKAKM